MNILEGVSGAVAIISELYRMFAAREGITVKELHARVLGEIDSISRVLKSAEEAEAREHEKRRGW